MYITLSLSSSAALAPAANFNTAVSNSARKSSACTPGVSYHGHFCPCGDCSHIRNRGGRLSHSALCACNSCVESHSNSCKCSTCTDVHDMSCGCNSCTVEVNQFHAASHDENCGCIVCA
mmetsp:Transcript_7330/g.13454  ORF Transcript_7330/g.13454 Transcript_7330/m.13454 type:complete len:119 (+) Transcript_7330:233-589(+)